MQKPFSGVFIQCINHIFDVAEVVTVVRKNGRFWWDDDFISVTSSCGEIQKFSELMEVPLKEAFILANQELTKQKAGQKTSYENTVFEILPTYEKENGKTQPIAGADATHFRITGYHPPEDFRGFKVFKRTIGFEAAP